MRHRPLAVVGSAAVAIVAAASCGGGVTAGGGAAPSEGGGDAASAGSDADDSSSVTRDATMGADGADASHPFWADGGASVPPNAADAEGADGSLPFWDDAGSCPFVCVNPVGRACAPAYRSTACAAGELCCGGGGVPPVPDAGRK
jgi:hypothetical protein